jgi:hypothetical protein
MPLGPSNWLPNPAVNPYFTLLVLAVEFVVQTKRAEVTEIASTLGPLVIVGADQDAVICSSNATMARLIGL